MIGVFGILIATLIGLGLVGQLWGFTTPSFTVAPPSTDSGGGVFSELVAIFFWVLNVVGSIFQLMTFQVDGLPEIFSVITLGLSFLTFYIGVRLVRGGG